MCPICASGKISKDQLSFLERLAHEKKVVLDGVRKEKAAAFQEEISFFEAHKQLAQIQLDFYRSLETNLPADTAIGIMDFTQVRSNQKDPQTGDQWFSSGPGIQWFSFVLSTPIDHFEKRTAPSPCTPFVVKDSTSIEIHPCKYFTQTKFEPPKPPVGIAFSGVNWNSAGDFKYTPTFKAEKYPLQHNYFDFFSDSERNLSPK